jgi:hypothetical protein
MQLGFRVSPSIGQQAPLLDGIKEQFGYGTFSPGRRVIQFTDDFATEHPKVVDVFADGVSRELKLDQVMDKWAKAVDDLPAGWEIFGKSHPTLGPLIEILAAWQPIKRDPIVGSRHGIRQDRSFLALLNHHAIDHDFKPMPPSFGICL